MRKPFQSEDCSLYLSLLSVWIACPMMSYAACILVWLLAIYIE